MPRWTPEARAAQAAKIRSWQPWRESTGPTTQAGKAVCKLNGLKHGRCTAQARADAKKNRARSSAFSALARLAMLVDRIDE